MNKAFTLRLLRCALIGFGAFVLLLALDVTIRSPLDVAGYVLGIGALWYVFELIVMSPKGKPVKKVKLTPEQARAVAERKARTDENELGEDHFD